ncbi:hypothetical protein UlMin_028046, partial [Ulmus minor]
DFLLGFVETIMINFGGLLSGTNKARRMSKTSHEQEAVSTEISLSFNNNNSTTYQNVPVQFFGERLLAKKINYGGQELPEEELELKLGLPDGGVYTPSSKEQTPTNLSLLTGVGHIDPEEGNSFSRIHVEAQHQQLQPQKRQPLMLFETQPPRLPLKVERKNEDMLKTIMNRRRSLERMMLPRSQSVPPHYRTRVWPRLGPALPQPQPPQPSEVAAWKASMAKSAPRRHALNQFRSTPGPAG